MRGTSELGIGSKVIEGVKEGAFPGEGASKEDLAEQEMLVL